MRAVGRTERQHMNLIVAFRNCGNAPNKTKLSTKERIQDTHFGSSHLVSRTEVCGLLDTPFAYD
jgi:hypothetical protein